MITDGPVPEEFKITKADELLQKVFKKDISEGQLVEIVLSRDTAFTSDFRFGARYHKSTPNQIKIDSEAICGYVHGANNSEIILRSLKDLFKDAKHDFTYAVRREVIEDYRLAE